MATYAAGLTIAVIGAGTAGRAFAIACAAAGYAVVLEDVMPAKLRAAEAELGPLTRGVRMAMTVEDAVGDADLVVDFVPDELESKLEIWSLIDRMAPPRTIMCTPSEVLSITDLASCTYRQDRCVMVRGLQTPIAGSRVEVLTARGTSNATRLLTMTLFEQLGAHTGTLHDPDLPMLLKNMNAINLS